MQSYSPNVDYLMTDPAVQKICQIADVPTDSCSVAFLDAKVSCGKLDPKNKNILLPKIEENNQMNFFPWKNHETLIINKYGILEPIKSKPTIPNGFCFFHPTISNCPWSIASCRSSQ